MSNPSTRLSRRELLLTSSCAAVGAAGAIYGFSARPARAEAVQPYKAPASGKRVAHVFDIAERPTALPCFNGKAEPLWTFDPETPFPIVRVQLGDTFAARLKNNLTRPGEHLTIHWHGLRVPIESDGVPFITQQPIMPGSEGAYEFVPPDTGTYFFHTHCNTVEHFGRGLFGAFIVEGDEVHKSDAEVVLMMKDWHVAADGTLGPFSTDEGAAKGGTAGSVRAINGAARPSFDVPAGANVRVRLINVDPVRITEVGIEGANAAIIAVDGNACVPIPLESWRLAPAQRLDILMRSPADGQRARLIDYYAPQPVMLADFAAKGPARRKGKFVAHALRAGSVPAADLKSATRVPFDFSATATGEAIAEAAAIGFDVDALCLSRRTFWAINKQAWASVDHKDLGPPLVTLKSGGSYIIEMHNLTSHAHPIHIHGHTFEFVSSSLRKLPPHRADTILLMPKERVEVALVGGKPGRWMFHCHILEHQETGMMGYVAVA